jgi:hypothetical protein
MVNEIPQVDIILKNKLNIVHDFIISVIDTDSLTVSKPDQTEFSQDEIDVLTSEINAISDELIRWEFEFYLPKLIVVKSKNYILFENGKIKTKGASLRDQKREPALKEMINTIIESMVYDRGIDDLNSIYKHYIKEATNPKDILRWSQKKTVTSSVMNCKGYEDLSNEDEDSPRKNETDVYNAIKSEEGLQQGDKIYLYPIYMGKVKKIQDKRKRNKETGLMETIGQVEVEKDTYGLKLAKYYENDIATDKLIKRVYDTIKIFESVINIDDFPKYHNKTNKLLLEELLNESK